MLELVAGAALRSLLLAMAVGTGLRLRRRCDPRVPLAAWTFVLVASLLMPVAMRVTSLALPHDMIAVTRLPFAPELFARIEASSVLSPAEPIAPYVTPPNWRGLATVLWFAMFSALMLRLLAGLALSWRIVRAATPVREDWVGGFDVRTSQQVNAPATFGSVILLPADHAAWTPARRLAVLAHEGAHVARRDFAIQLAASVNRTIFWFNPFSWWLRRHLSDLAEAASDDAAIARLNDRLGYAEILLEISGRVASLPGAISMARGSDVASRIERILSETPLPAGVSRRGRVMLGAGIFPFAVSLSFLTILPAPVPVPLGPLLAEAPASVEILADEGTPEDIRQPMSPPALALATMAPVIAPPPALAQGPDVASLPAPPSMAPPSQRLSAAAGEAPRPSPRSTTRNTVAAQTSRSLRRLNRIPENQAVLDRSPEPKVVNRVGPQYATNRPEPSAGENSQSPLFKRLLNETCWGTYSGVVASASARRYPVQAHFYRGPGDRPWVAFYSAPETPANLPVTISGTEIKFTNTYGAVFTLSSSRDMLPAQYHRLSGSTEHSPGGAVDIACGESNRRL
jgi:beta-lactamase regulating signal transducer with metallopeptidase domain